MSTTHVYCRECGVQFVVDFRRVMNTEFCKADHRTAFDMRRARSLLGDPEQSTEQSFADCAAPRMERVTDGFKGTAKVDGNE